MAGKLDKLFKPTEPTANVGNDPEPMETATPAVKQRKPQRIKPQSVYLNESELAYIQEIADKYGESRHAVMQYAIKELIRQWKAGKKPRTNNLGKLDR